MRQTLQSYPAVAPADALLSFSVSTGVDEQPIGLEVTAEGARNRAVAAHAEARGGLRLVQRRDSHAHAGLVRTHCRQPPLHLGAPRLQRSLGAAFAI